MSVPTANLVGRLWRTAVVVCLAFGACLFLLYRVGAVEIRPLHRPMSDLPLQILQYIGAEGGMSEEVAKRVNAIDSVSRTYTDPQTKNEISLHVAAFTGLGEPTLPHPPRVCYPAAGGRIVGEKPVEVGPKDATIVGRLMTVERNNVTSLVLYWYSWDDMVCTTRSQAAMTRLRLVGRSQWPPVVKVLMEMPIDGTSQEPEQDLLRFAAEVHARTQKL